MYLLVHNARQGGIFMLNDYEIRRYDKLLATLKLMISVMALYIVVQTVPSFIEWLEESRPSYTEDFMVRIVANSNTAQDQQVKQQMAVDIAELMNNPSTAAMEKDEFMQQIERHIAKNYTHLHTEMKNGDNLIPPKLLAHTFYPQHVKNSLVIVIGNGRGDNWFCSMFPMVCEDPEQQEKEKVRFKLIDC